MPVEAHVAPAPAVDGAPARLPGWLWPALLVALVSPLHAFVWPETPENRPSAAHAWTVVANLLIGCGALLWAARRPALPARLRSSLRLMGATSIFSTAFIVVTVAFRAGGAWNEQLNAAGFLASYVLGLTALLVYPRVPLRRGVGASLAVDVAVSAGTLGVLSWCFGGGAEIWASGEPWGLTVALAPLCLIAGLNVVVVAGRAVPTRRAFWWFVAGQAAYLPFLYLDYFARHHPALEPVAAAVYLWGSIPALIGAALIGSDPIDAPAPPRGGSPGWLLHLNPVALSSPLVLGAFLLDATLRGGEERGPLLAAALLAVTAAGVARLGLTAAENARLARDEAEGERRLQAAKMAGIGRLAGGIAHEFNNLMATVISTANMGAGDAAPGSPVREDFDTIHLAGRRAADLTRQLLRFSGQEVDRRGPHDLAEAIARLGPRLREAAGPRTELRLGLAPAPRALVDLDQLEALLVELARNAGHAMPGGGPLRISVGPVRLHAPRPSRFLAAPPGDLVELQVEDAGTGIAPDVLPRIFEPFFSTRDLVEAKGLGLAEVHGIVAAHGGGLDVESAPGKGTRFTILLPAARDQGRVDIDG